MHDSRPVDVLEREQQLAERNLQHVYNGLTYM